MSSPRRGFGRTLWIGAAGTGIGFGIAKSVREHWGSAVTIIAADMLPRHLFATSVLADRTEQISRISDPDFSVQLIAGLRRTGADTYVPIEDSEIVAAARLRDESAFPAALAVVAPPAGVAETCFDKLATANWLAAHGLPTPVTLPAREAEWHPGGLVIKPRRGRGSVGVSVVRSREQFEAVRGEPGDLIVQHRCDGPEVTVDAFMSKDRTAFRALCRERIEVKAGVCTKARIFEDEILSDLVRRIASGIGLGSAFCIQFMKHPDTRDWLVTDINPRPGAGTRMSAAIGVDFLGALLADAWDIDFRSMLPSLKQKEHFVLRQYAEYVATRE